MKKILVFFLVLVFSFGITLSVFGEESCEHKVISEKFDMRINEIKFSNNLSSYAFI
jgi:hypothetical protein